MNIKIFKNKISKFLTIVILACTFIKCDMNLFASQIDYKFINGYVVYKNALYSIAHYNDESSVYSFNGLKSINLLFPKSTMTIIPVPMSQLMIEDVSEIHSQLASQSEYVEKMKEHIKDTNIKIIDLCDTFINHKDEYIYFKYDHHWQSIGAYYAYKEFCKANNLECDDIDEYRKVVLNKTYRGGAYKKILPDDKSIEGYSDVLTAYIASVSNVMKIYNASNHLISNGKPCINEEHNAYWGIFLSGDNPYVEISSKISKKRTALVIKDSFGCAFVPFLVSNYDEIYVVDPRFASFDLVEKMKNKNIYDIIVVSANYTFGQPTFYNGLANLLPKT